MIVFGRERARWTYLVVLVLFLQFTMRASCRLDVVNQRNVLESENENIILLKPSDKGNDSIKPSKERGAPNFEGDIVVSTTLHLAISYAHPKTNFIFLQRIQGRREQTKL